MTYSRHILVVLIMTLTVVTSAQGQDIETLVMPGEVIAGHADIEAECSSCHKMFDKGAQRELCMDCHEEVALDVNAPSGYHGLYPEAVNVQCSVCHTDHAGRDADIVILDENNFDHSFTDFELAGAHRENECSDCHAAGEKHREAPGDCVACHDTESPHEETMGGDCASCHEPTDWADGQFDHGTTDYPLIGKHDEAACLDCHADHTFPAPPTDCYSCHKEDDAHDGRSGQQCGNCHNPSDWNDSSFDHVRDTDFPLEGTHATLACGDCHSDNPFEDEMNTDCVACHLEDDAHEGNHGDKCDTCHESTEWTAAIFDHGRDTNFQLAGRHTEIACADCHVEPVFEVKPSTSCESCHQDDDPHEGTSSMQCESCHTEVNWQDPVFFDHDLTRFPLHGVHAENECEDCHTTQAFATTERNCTACHQDDDPHRGYFPERCDSCHTPVAWDLWTFDHNLQTDFLLEGAHIDVACEDCHRGPLEKMQILNGNCGSCHKTDDDHDGEFGSDCGRCHTADSFKEVRSLQ